MLSSFLFLCQMTLAIFLIVLFAATGKALRTDQPGLFGFTTTRVSRALDKSAHGATMEGGRLPKGVLPVSRSPSRRLLR